MVGSPEFWTPAPILKVVQYSTLSFAPVLVSASQPKPGALTYNNKFPCNYCKEI